MRRLLVLVMTAVLVACGGGGDDEDDAATSTTNSTSTTTATARITATVDWTARTVELEGQEAFDVEFCEGDAPMLCVSADGEALGAVERISFDAVGDLTKWATDFYGSIAADRKAGCDPGYELEADRPVPAPFGGIEGIRYAFTGSIDGIVVERVVGYAAERDGKLDLLAANAFSDDFCVERIGELPVVVMAAFEPVLAALAEGTVG